MGISTLFVTIGLASQTNFSFIGVFLILSGLCLFSFVFGISVGPTTWLYMSEVADL